MIENLSINNWKVARINMCSLAELICELPINPFIAAFIERSELDYYYKMMTGEITQGIFEQAFYVDKHVVLKNH
jgi:hypothetical protein